MKKDDLNKKQRYALDTMLSGSNVFLTGDAGTGKTTVIQTFIDEAEKAGKNIPLHSTMFLLIRKTVYSERKPENLYIPRCFY